MRSLYIFCFTVLVCLCVGDQTEPRNELLVSLVEQVKGVSSAHIVFVVDGSSSIVDQDWGLMKRCLYDIIAVARSDAIKASLIVFSSNVQVIFQERPLVADRPTIQSSISNLLQPKQLTSTGLALTEAYNLIAKSSTGYSSTTVVLLTDGYPTDDPFPAAGRLKAIDNVRIIGVGFGQVNSTVMQWLASPNSVLVTKELEQIVNAINNVIAGGANYTGINLRVEVDERKGYSFSSPLEVQLVITNKAMRTIPAGSNMYFSEIQATASQEGNHFVPTRYVIPVDILYDGTHKFPVKFDTTRIATVRTLPKYIRVILTDPAKNQIVFHISLVSNIFANDLIDTMWRMSADPHLQLAVKYAEYFSLDFGNFLRRFNNNSVNILLVGPFGHGKSLLHNLMFSVLSFKQVREEISTVGDGSDHETTKTLHTFAKDYLPIPGFSLRVTDTMGISETNFKKGYYNSLLNGTVPNNHYGGNGSDELEVAVPSDTNKTHVAVFVVGHQIVNALPDNPILQTLKESIKTARQHDYKPIPVVTFMSTVSEDKKEKTLEQVLKKMGLSGPAFPLSYDNGHPDREFSVDLEVLTILYEVAARAKKKLPRHEEIPQLLLPTVIAVVVVIVTTVITCLVRCSRRGARARQPRQQPQPQPQPQQPQQQQQPLQQQPPSGVNLQTGSNGNNIRDDFVPSSPDVIDFTRKKEEGDNNTNNNKNINTDSSNNNNNNNNNNNANIKTDNNNNDSDNSNNDKNVNTDISNNTNTNIKTDNNNNDSDNNPVPKVQVIYKFESQILEFGGSYANLLHVSVEKFGLTPGGNYYFQNKGGDVDLNAKAEDGVILKLKICK